MQSSVRAWTIVTCSVAIGVGGGRRYEANPAIQLNSPDLLAPYPEMMVSGRGGFEIVQKSLAAGVPLLDSVSAPSSLAVRLARELSLTLIGFLRDRRFVVYSNPERCLPSQP